MSCLEKSRNNAQSGAKCGRIADIFTRGFTMAAGINLFIMTAYYIIFMTGTLHVREVYKASLSIAGFSSSIMVVGCVVARFFAGNLLSTFGGRKILALGILSFTGSVYAFFWVDSLAWLFAQRFWTGISIGLTASATGTLAAVMVPQEHRGLGVSLFSMSTALAMAAGPSLMFISLPKVFDAMSGVGTIVGIAFFVMVAFAALTSSISLMETVVSIIQDKSQVKL